MRIESVYHDRTEISRAIGLNCNGETFPDLADDTIFYTTGVAGALKSENHFRVYQARLPWSYHHFGRKRTDQSGFDRFI